MAKRTRRATPRKKSSGRPKANGRPPAARQSTSSSAGPPTEIEELDVMDFTAAEHQAIQEILVLADGVQIDRLNAKGGVGLRYRIELAAALLSFVIGHCHDYCEEEGVPVQPLADLAVDLTVRRARELFRMAEA